MAKKKKPEPETAPKMPKHAYEGSDATLMQIFHSYREGAFQARLSRIQQNKINFDTYHLRQDYSYKEKGQSQEFLPKMAMAVEEGSNFLQQGLVKMGDWFHVYPAPGVMEDDMKIKPIEIENILKHQLLKAGFLSKVGDMCKLGFLGAQMIAKVHGRYVPKAKFIAEKERKADGSYAPKLLKKEDRKWQLSISLIRQQDWFPDPSNAEGEEQTGLYNMQELYMDWHMLKKLADQPGSTYDKQAIEGLKAQASVSSNMQEYEKSRETGENLYNVNFRNRIKLTELWGDFVSPDGELLYENCVATLANDNIIIQRPTQNGLWHGKDPYVSASMLRVPHSPWGKTPMDSGSLLNIALNEMFNLMMDGGMAAIHGIKQVREHWLEDTSQIEDGLAPGTTLRVNTACPPGATAFERVDTTTIPPEVLPMYNIVNQEFVTAAMTNDLRQGVMPDRQVKATAIVEASQTTNTMFSAIAEHVESDAIKPILEKAWLTIAQNIKHMDQNELTAILNPRRAQAILSMSAEELFAETAGMIKFEVFGISETINMQKMVPVIQGMFQTVASSPVMMEQFSAKYDFGKLMTQWFRAANFPIYKIMRDDILYNNTGTGSATQNQGQPGQAQQQPNTVPNAQSQIPQAGAAVNNPGPNSAFPQPNFPGSPALAGQTGGPK